jgi:hypothetical protein
VVAAERAESRDVLVAGFAAGWLLAAYGVFGLGSGAVNPPITNAAVSGMLPSQAGVAAAVATTSRQVGLTLGVAVVGAVATARVDGSLHIISRQPATRRGGSSPPCAPGSWP